MQSKLTGEEEDGVEGLQFHLKEKKEGAKFIQSERRGHRGSQKETFQNAPQILETTCEFAGFGGGN